MREDFPKTENKSSKDKRKETVQAGPENLCSSVSSVQQDVEKGSERCGRCQKMDGFAFG